MPELSVQQRAGVPSRGLRLDYGVRRRHTWNASVADFGVNGQIELLAAEGKVTAIGVLLKLIPAIVHADRSTATSEDHQTT